jgi:hypothetical protein
MCQKLPVEPCLLSRQQDFQPCYPPTPLLHTPTGALTGEQLAELLYAALKQDNEAADQVSQPGHCHC